ncbi:TetR family transcriptional regulator [Deinococcus ruber]|uniref:TetR family transcriptional regulator n=1 Tax=Deinococcus ruber TaxID=1848197 RepID=A0A918CEV0_9DEIO|nr:TetR family transcriptional regulator [Deinococcus ruber]
MIFREHGLHVPLQLIADHAGVGRGTLYRHFPDRERLVLAMVTRRLELIETRLAAASDAAHSVPEIFDWIADTLSAIPGLHPYLATTAQGPATLTLLGQRLQDLLAGPIRVAQQQGLLRSGVTFDDFLAGWAMIEGSLLAVAPESRAWMAIRAKHLIHSALFADSA